jgi:hypothetical protein
MARLKARVVLLAASELEMSLWGMRLRLAGYSVLATTDAAEAVSAVESDAVVSVLVAQAGWDESKPQVRFFAHRYRSLRVVVFDGEIARRAKFSGDVFLLPGVESEPAQVLSYVKRFAKHAPESQALYRAMRLRKATSTARKAMEEGLVAA